MSLFLFQCLSYILSSPALFSKCPNFTPVFPLETSSPSAPQTELGLSLSSYQQSKDRPSVFIYVVSFCRNMCAFEYLRWMKKGYFLKKCLCLLVFFCVLLPLFQRLSLLKRRNVSDLSIVGMGENEKQMLDPYAGAVSSFWHTNTLPRIRPGVGGDKESQEGTKFKLVCVCVFARKHTHPWAWAFKCTRGRLNASETLFKGMLANK